MKSADRATLQKKTREALNFLQLAHGKLQDGEKFDLVGAKALLGLTKQMVEAIDRAITNG
jgi:hypothetical protein